MLCIKQKILIYEGVLIDMQAAYCIECGIETYQQDGLCVLCKTGITQLYKQLIYLLNEDKSWVLRQN